MENRPLQVLGIAMSQRAHVRVLRSLEMVVDTGDDAILVTNQSSAARSITAGIRVVDVGLPRRLPGLSTLGTVATRLYPWAYAVLKRRFERVLGHIRPWQLARYVMRRRLSDLDPGRVDLVVMGDELAGPLAWRLVRRYPELTVTGIINRDQLEAHRQDQTRRSR